MPDYDYIIAGGGCAGLSLAYHITLSGNKSKILILESSAKNENDRTWAFWKDYQLPFEQIIYKSYISDLH